MQPNPFLIAEIAQGYEGNAKLVELFVRAAANAGADAVKFQVLAADDSALPDYQHYKLFKSLELPAAVWEKALHETHQKGMLFFSDALGLGPVLLLNNIGIDGYKIHATNVNNIRLLKLVAQTKKPVLLSTGGCEKKEVDRAIELLDGCAITLMHGFQAEPTEIADNHLKRIKALQELYNLPIGFQDHTAGDSRLANYLPFVALGAGVTTIEKHLTLSRKAEMEDYVSASTPEEFAVWASMMREAVAALGEERWILTEKERKYRMKVRRAVCTVEDISEGQLMTEEILVLKRTSQQDVLYEFSEVVGRKAKHAINKNVPVRSIDLL